MTFPNMEDIPTRQATCETHGSFASRHLFGSAWSKCPKCSAEREAHDKAEAEARAKAERIEAWQRKVGDAGIPERFRNRSLQSFVAETGPQAKALAFAMSYADGFDEVMAVGRSAVFIGTPGTGKTHLACGIGLRIMHRGGHSVLFSTVMRAVRSIKDTWTRGAAQTETEAVAALVFPDLLILDEIGVQFGSETEKLILFDVLNARYEKRRPTLLLSNLSLDEVKVFLGERIYDRLREDGGQVVVFDWRSHRGEAKAA